jgi:hypothetical protein
VVAVEGEEGGRVYAIGGWVDGTYATGLTEEYDPEGDKWTVSLTFSEHSVNIQ